MEPLIFSPASQFAIDRHKGQLYGRRPYHVHLLQVVNVLIRYYEWEDMRQELIDAAWLHDVVEDTDVTVSQVRELFGEKTAALVHAVTKLPPGPGTKKERMTIYYAKIRETPGAINVKLADRIANVEQSASRDRIGRRPGKYFEKYKQEHPGFEYALRRRSAGEGGSAMAMWHHLESILS